MIKILLQRKNETQMRARLETGCWLGGREVGSVHDLGWSAPGVTAGTVCLKDQMESLFST